MCRDQDDEPIIMNEEDEAYEQQRVQKRAAQEAQYFEYLPDPDEHKLADSDKPLTLAQEKELLKKKLLAP